MGLYSIKELERLSGIKAHTIRVWERRYSILCPDRTDTNIRLYDDKELKRIINISILNRNGLKISKLAKLSDEEIADKIMHISSESGEHDDIIEMLIGSMIDLDESRFGKVFSHSVLRIGFEKTIVQIVFPFLNRVGILWQSDTVSPAQEHFVSQLVRQKILVAIDAIEPFLKPWSKKFLLFLPEREWHELSLLFLQYILKKNNHHVVYLGQSVPFDDIVKIAETNNTDVLLYSVSTAQSAEEQQAYLERLSEQCPKAKIWLHTRTDFSENEMFLLPQNAWLVNNPDEIYQQIIRLKFE